MLKIDWNIVVSILTALGIFEIIKKILLFSLENNLIKRNLEIREIAERALNYCNWLKLRNFEQPLGYEETAKLTLDILKVDSFDKKLGDDLMHLVNNPRMMNILYNDKDGGERNRDFINKLHKEVYEINERLTEKLNYLRYKPIIQVGKFSI